MVFHNTPLNLASKKGNYSIVEQLLNIGANLNLKNKDFF